MFLILDKQVDFQPKCFKHSDQYSHFPRVDEFHYIFTSFSQNNTVNKALLETGPFQFVATVNFKAYQNLNLYFWGV